MGNSYYKFINRVRMDRALLDAAEEAIAGQGDGRISKADAENLLTRIFDGGNITSTEKNTIHYILRHFNFTDAARALFLERLDGVGSGSSGSGGSGSSNSSGSSSSSSGSSGSSSSSSGSSSSGSGSSGGDTGGQFGGRTIAEIINMVIRQEYQFYRMQVDIPEQEVRDQVRTIGGSNTFEEALRDGIASFLEDPSHPDSARRVIFNLNAQDLRHITDEEELENRVTDLLRQAMDEGIFRIWKTHPDGAEGPEDLTPPGGETLAEYWIWEMFLPRVSDHAFYAILDRGNQKPTYNYGFN